MKKTTIIFSLLLVAVLMNAQNTISSVFITMPDNLLLGINAEQRAELVASADSSTLTVETEIKEDVERIALTEDYIALKTSDAGTLQIKLLPLVNNTDIIGVITTVCGPACDSKIDFYTTSWEPLAQADIFPAKDKNWFLSVNGDADTNVIENLSAILDMSPIKYSFDPNSKDVKVEYDIENYLSSDDYNLVKPLLVKEPIVLKWDKLSYKR